MKRLMLIPWVRSKGDSDRPDFPATGSTSSQQKGAILWHWASRTWNLRGISNTDTSSADGASTSLGARAMYLRTSLSDHEPNRCEVNSRTVSWQVKRVLMLHIVYEITTSHRSKSNCCDLSDILVITERGTRSEFLYFISLYFLWSWVS